MRALARKFDQHEHEEVWALAGLLHDLDWELTKDTPHEHSLKSATILQDHGAPAEVVNAVRVHNHIHGFQPETLMEKALYATEEITGLIVAATLVLPGKKISDLTVDSVMRKFKEKSFAAGVNREILKRSQELIGLSVEEVSEIALKAMQGISDELGL